MMDAEKQLLNELSQPDDAVVQTVSGFQGDLLLLGAGGKIGHALSLMAKRAVEKAGAKTKVLAVSRFSDPKVRQQFQDDGIETIACDLVDTAAVRKLPDASDVVYMVGQKFGTSAGSEAMTWLLNCYVPGVVAERFAGSRIAAYSSGNVYAYVKADSDGPTEEGQLGPIGEYAQSVVGRERVFEHFSRVNGTKVTTIRLNYANEPRYGVLVDIAAKVYRGEPVDVTQGHANVVWQGDCNRITLRCLDIAASPPRILNLSGPKISVREMAHKFAAALGKEAIITGEESDMSMLNNGGFCWQTFGPPSVDVDGMVKRIADWIKADLPTWNKPTKFEVRNGKF